MNIPLHDVLDVCAVCSGIVGVWLTAKQHIWCWPAGIVSVCIQGFRFFQTQLYADAALQMLFVVMGVYGWYYWRSVYKIRYIKLKLFFLNAFYVSSAGILLWVLFYQVLVYSKGSRPLLDSGLTVLSIIATGYTVLKHKRAWVFWIGIDTLYVLLFALQNLWYYCLLYLVYAILAVYGFLEWRIKKK
jgi:nicotinamide mononucleotide transporter